MCASCATEIDKDPDRFPVSILRHWKSTAETEALTWLQHPSYRRLGIPRPPFAPPLEYQRRALAQILRHLGHSGINAVSVPQLARIIPNALLRDDVNPIFEPLSVEMVSDAIDEFVRDGTVGVEGQLLVLRRTT